MASRSDANMWLCDSFVVLQEIARVFALAQAQRPAE